MNDLRGYDAWLERPYQQELEAQEAEEDLDDRAHDAAWEVALSITLLPDEVADKINNEKFLSALSEALREVAVGRTQPSVNAESEERAVAALNAALNELISELKQTERERLIEEDRAANARAADDLAAELHEAQCRSRGIDP